MIVYFFMESVYMLEACSFQISCVLFAFSDGMVGYTYR